MEIKKNHKQKFHSINISSIPLQFAQLALTMMHFTIAIFHLSFSAASFFFYKT